jgi:hypothetical protein
VAKERSRELYLNVFGDQYYERKNEYNPVQKKKILEYLQIHVFTISAEFEEQKKIKFADFDPHFLANIPKDFEELRFKIMKGNTNLAAAQDSLERLKNSKKEIAARYLNEQAYEFDRARYNSLSWGLLIGALINMTIYRRGNIIRKSALFLACGHLTSIVGYRNNLDRYFDAVYPIFQEEAVKFTQEEGMAYKNWKP